MDRSNKNRAWHWLQRSATKPKSIKARLLIGIGCVFLLTWLIAAFFTKMAAFDKSRDFLVSQAAYNAQLLLELTFNQPLNSSIIEEANGRAAVLWQGEKQILIQGGDIASKLMPYKGISGDVVDKIGLDNWIIASRCKSNNCAVVAIRDTERKFAIRWLVASIYLPLLGIFILSMFGIFFVVKLGMRPLDELTREVRKLDFAKLERLPTQSHSTELAPLVKAIDTLSVGMSDQLKRERVFLDTCAHEIRTPITGLISQVQLLENLDKDGMSADLQTQVKLIEHSARRTARVANQFLSLARTNNTLADFSNATDFDLCELVRTNIADFLMLTPDADIQMIGNSSIWVKGEPFTIELIIQNLIDNALRHGDHDKGRKILVTCKKVLKGVSIRVEDNGCGVQASAFASLTKRFFKAEKSINKQEATSQVNPDTPVINAAQGAGLGLSIVREVLDSYGGDLVFLKSEELGGLAVNVHINIADNINFSQTGFSWV